jgi:hypothetical protein
LKSAIALPPYSAAARTFAVPPRSLGITSSAEAQILRHLPVRHVVRLRSAHPYWRSTRQPGGPEWAIPRAELDRLYFATIDPKLGARHPLGGRRNQKGDEFGDIPRLAVARNAGRDQKRLLCLIEADFVR